MFAVFRSSGMRLRALAVAVALTVANGPALAGQSNQEAIASEIEQAQAAPPPEPEHSGWGSLIKNSAGDFASFPRRPSTWVILGVGGAAALLAHPADDYVTSAHCRIDHGRARVRSRQVDRFCLRPGWYGGWSVSRRAVCHQAQCGRLANEQVVPSRLRLDARADRDAGDRARHQVHPCNVIGPPVNVARFRPAMPPASSRPRRCWSAISATAARGPPSWLRATSRHRAWWTIATSSATSSLVQPSALPPAGRWWAAMGGRSMSLVPIPVRGGVFLALTRVPRSAQ